MSDNKKDDLSNDGDKVDPVLEGIRSLIDTQALMVEALKYAKMRLELADEDRFDKSTLRLINHALKAAGDA